MGLDILLKRRFIYLGGGAALAYMHVGALDEINTHLHGTRLTHIYEGIGGCSAGALVALVLVACDGDVERVSAIFMKHNVTDIMRKTSLMGAWRTGGVISYKVLREQVLRIMNDVGLDETATFAKLSELSMCTFACNSSDVVEGRHVTYSTEETPDQLLLDAVSRSMALWPLVSPSHTSTGGVHIDGAFLGSVDYHIFGTDNIDSLCVFKLCAKDEDYYLRKDALVESNSNVISYMLCIVSAMQCRINDLLQEKYGDRVLQVELMSRTRASNDMKALSMADKIGLMEEGRRSIRKWVWRD